MTGPVRDRLSWMVYLQLGFYGYFLYAFTPTTPLLREELGVSRSQGGLYGTALASGAIITGLFGTRLVTRFGRGRLLWAGVAVLVAGTAGYALGPTYVLTLVGAMTCGIGGALLLNTANAVLMDARGEQGPAALSEANATGAGVGIVAPLVVGGAEAVGLGWRAGLLVVAVLAVAVFATFRRVVVPAPTPTDPALSIAGSTHLPVRYWVTWVVLVCVIGIEFCLSMWSPDLLRTRLGLSGGASTAAWSGALVGLFLSRLAGGRLAVRFSLDRLLTQALVVVLVGFAMFWAAGPVWLAVVGLGVCGLGLGLLFPLTMGRAVRAAKGRSDLASARASIGAGIAVGLGPLALGAAADHVGTHTAFLVVPGLAVVAMAGLAISREPRAVPAF